MTMFSNILFGVAVITYFVFNRKASGFFKMPTELVVTAESPIVQIDFADDKLLVSAQTKCVICDTKK